MCCSLCAYLIPQLSRHDYRYFNGLSSANRRKNKKIRRGISPQKTKSRSNMVSIRELAQASRERTLLFHQSVFHYVGRAKTHSMNNQSVFSQRSPCCGDRLCRSLRTRTTACPHFFSSTSRRPLTPAADTHVTRQVVPLLMQVKTGGWSYLAMLTFSVCS